VEDSERHLRRAIELAFENVEAGGQPFGAVVVKDREVVATGVNEMHVDNDPTAHAEVTALRAAGRVLGSSSLAGCTVYASGHPCPMCMAAMRMAGVTAVDYAYSNEDGKPYGLSSAAVYEDLARPFAEQSMKIRHVPARLESRPDLYDQWALRGERG
jgi:tRNA(Arg) A34 adenosine deaminase TadA